MKNDLMIPRIEVKPYPHYPFDGNILLIDEDGELYHETEKYCQSVYKIVEADIEKYPHLFRNLSWWEKREENELPEYVKNDVTGIVYKVARVDEKWSGWGTNGVCVHDENGKGFNFLKERVSHTPYHNRLFPATESEYLSWLNNGVENK